MLLQRFQAANHRLDPAACLFLFPKQLRAFIAQLLDLLPQAAVFIVQALHADAKQVDACQQLVQFTLQVALIHPPTLGRRRAWVKLGGDGVASVLGIQQEVQAGVGFALLPGRMKKVYENDVQLLKLAEPYQMRQLISIVYSHHRERDADLLALAAEGRMYARSINR